MYTIIVHSIMCGFLLYLEVGASCDRADAGSECTPHPHDKVPPQRVLAERLHLRPDVAALTLKYGSHFGVVLRMNNVLDVHTNHINLHMTMLNKVLLTHIMYMQGCLILD